MFTLKKSYIAKNLNKFIILPFRHTLGALFLRQATNVNTVKKNTTTKASLYLYSMQARFLWNRVCGRLGKWSRPPLLYLSKAYSMPSGRYMY